MGKTAYEILNKSIVVCTVTDNPQVTVTIHPVLAVSAAFLRLSMKGFQHNCEPSQGCRGLLVLFLKDRLFLFLGSALPPQPALCFEVFTRAKFVFTIQWLSKIIRDFMSDGSNAQTWVSAFSTGISWLPKEIQSTKHIPAQGRWCWQTKETLGITFRCFFIKGIYHPILQHWPCASQHKVLLWSYLNVLLGVQLTTGDGLHAGRQSYGAESSAHLENKQSSYDL